MAQRRKSAPKNTPVTPTIARRRVPEQCPICQAIPDIPIPTEGTPKLTAEALLRSHLRRHQPAGKCPREHTNETSGREWVLDWDLIQYPRDGVLPWRCTTCGRYAKS